MISNSFSLVAMNLLLFEVITEVFYFYIVGHVVYIYHYFKAILFLKNIKTPNDSLIWCAFPAI